MLVKLNQATTQNGFTLVEVLTVMLVLVAIASVTIEVSSDLAFQNRYEVTKDRYEKIKRAIIGRPDVLINGQPDISGFVADMGRLPDNIRELFQAGYCVTTGGTAPADLVDKWRPSLCLSANGHEWLWSTTPCSDPTKTTESDCTGGHRWMGQPTSSGLTLGWNGPYITTTKDPNSNNAISDGWGTIIDNLNYGWNFNNSSDTNLTLNSLGKDGSSTGSEYDQDYPGTNFIAINSGELQVNINGIQAYVLSKHSGSCNVPTCSDPAFADQISCEKDNKTWNNTDSICLAPILINQSSCESFPSFVWDAANSRCTDPRYTTETTCNSTLRTWTNHGKQNCELGGSTWNMPSPTPQICLKVQYRTIDSNGKTQVSTSPLISGPQDIMEDGQQHLITFNNFFEDTNLNGQLDAGTEPSVNQISFGPVILGVYEYLSSTSTCTTTRYNGVSVDSIANTHPTLPLPIIYW